MRKKIYCSLDVGNSKLAAVVAKLENRRFNILGNEILPVKGLSRGVVKDLVSLTDCIQQVLGKIMKKANVNIKDISVSVNGEYINARSSFAAFALSERANRHISLSDINYLRRQARLLGAHIDESLLHEFPQDYILDGSHSTFKPVGLLARKIQLNSYLLSAPYTLLGNIKTAVRQAGYEVENMVYSGIASSYGVLSEKEKKEGVLLVDLGACFTSLLFFKDNILRDFKMISFGGNDITDDISKSLGLSWDLAEEIKKSSLILSAADSKYSDTVVIRRSGSYKNLERKEIYESAKIRMEEFLNKIKESIDSSDWKDKIECGIVGVGGTANLEGILERIESSTGLHVRLGFVNNTSLINDIAGPQYAAAIGLLNYASHSKDVPILKDYFIGKTSFDRAVNFLRHLYQEYF
ncbi:MAG: cell division protein FtsA [Candidatus Omnitrophota bacterium]